MLPSGVKSWRWSYTFPSPADNRLQKRTIAFGKFPDVPLVLARERYYEARKKRAAGTDPMVARKETKLAIRATTEAEEANFAVAAEKWMIRWSKGKPERSIKAQRKRLDEYLLPALGNKSLNSINAQDVRHVVEPLEEKGMSGKPAPEQARRCWAITSQIFSFAIAKGLAMRNPTKDINIGDALTPPGEVKHHAHVESKELPALLRAMHEYPGNPQTKLALELLSLTLVRTNELVGARWGEIDWAGNCWRIPATRMKMHGAHIVPLSTQARGLLEYLQKATVSTDLIFPDPLDPDKPMDPTLLVRALWAMGYKHQMTAHGWRALGSTWLHEAGYDHQHIELQLAHSPRDRVSASYNFATYLEPRRTMMQRWADHLDEARESGKLLIMTA